MELQNAQSDIIISDNTNAIPPQNEAKTTRRRSTKNIFKVALYMMRGSSRKPKALLPTADVESRSVWRKLLGSMRPLHLQTSELSPPSPKKMILPPPSDQQNVVDQGDDGFDSASEILSPSPSSSRYASAVGLNEMVQEEEEKVVKENGDGDDGMNIDAMADEFIAQFYKEMRLQQFDVVDPRYNEISMRSLGL